MILDLASDLVGILVYDEVYCYCYLYYLQSGSVFRLCRNPWFMMRFTVIVIFIIYGLDLSSDFVGILVYDEVYCYCYLYYLQPGSDFRLCRNPWFMMRFTVIVIFIIYSLDLTSDFVGILVYDEVYCYCYLYYLRSGSVFRLCRNPWFMMRFTVIVIFIIYGLDLSSDFVGILVYDEVYCYCYLYYLQPGSDFRLCRNPWFMMRFTVIVIFIIYSLDLTSDFVGILGL